jgi:hypothetical protein
MAVAVAPAPYRLAQAAAELVDIVAMVAMAVLPLLRHPVILAHLALVVVVAVAALAAVLILAEAVAELEC